MLACRCMLACGCMLVCGRMLGYWLVADGRPTWTSSQWSLERRTYNMENMCSASHKLLPRIPITEPIPKHMSKHVSKHMSKHTSKHMFKYRHHR